MPTALELTREEWRHYRGPTLDQMGPKELSAEELQGREQLLARVRAAAAFLKQRFGVRRVILFGSLAHRGWFAPDSDVDLVVEGLAGRDYWDAWEAVEEFVVPRPVDLIELEHVGESLRRAVDRYGVEF